MTGHAQSGANPVTPSAGEISAAEKGCCLDLVGEWQTGEGLYGQVEGDARRSDKAPVGVLYQQDWGAAAWRETDTLDIIIIDKKKKGPHILIIDSNF